MRLNQKGHTTIELALVVALSAMIMYAIYLVMLTGNNQSEAATLKLNIQDSAREGMYQMIQEIRLTGVNNSTEKWSIAAGCESMDLLVPDPASPTNADYTVNWNGSQSIRYSFDENDNQVVRDDLDSGNERIIANDVSSIMFTTDTDSPYTCQIDDEAEVVTVVLGVQRELMNGNLVPADPIEIIGQAEIRNA